MKNIRYLILCVSSVVILGFQPAYAAWGRQPLLVTVFHMPTCKACQKVISSIIPPVAVKYGSKVKWVYVDITEKSNYKIFLRLEKLTGRHLGSPTILIGKKVLVGVSEAADSLDKTIESGLASPPDTYILEGMGVDLLERFRSFGPLAVMGAGLIDGINPCAFTVIVFFVSFLSVAGYKCRETAVIGAAYIFAIFVTYLALGLGFFKAIYSLKGFFLVSKIIYLSIGSISFYLGGLALKDYFIYKKTGKTDGMALQLPAFVKNRIHKIVGDYYRKDKNSQARSLFSILISALVVGFLISLLEAVCTGQMYLPTIVFVLKEGQLRAKALFYLIAYNLMFILPLVVILIFSLAGVSSKQFETLARKHLGMVKLAMAAVFLALGVVLWLGL